MKQGFIQTQNYKKFIEGVKNLKNTPIEEFHSARMALFYGSYGVGKTWAIEKMAAEEDKSIIFLRAEEVWTKSYLIKKISIQLGSSLGKVSDMSDEIKNKLLTDERIIVVDEVDKLLTAQKHELLEVFRDLTDQTSCVVIFIGMEQAPLKWAKHGHYYSRLKLIKMLPTCKEDIESFCTLSEVKITEDVICHFDKKYRNLRLIKRKIESLEEYCEKNDIDVVDMKIYKQSGVEK